MVGIGPSNNQEFRKFLIFRHLCCKRSGIPKVRNVRLRKKDIRKLGKVKGTPTLTTWTGGTGRGADKSGSLRLRKDVEEKEGKSGFPGTSV
jgi:hypothetical protein